MSLRVLVTGLLARVALGAALATLLGMSSAQAALQFPVVEIQTLTGDGGAIVSGAANGATLSIQATALKLLRADGTTLADFPDVPFSLVGTRTGATTFTGSLQIGQLLTATTTNISFTNLGGVAASFAADLTYTAGDLFRPTGPFYGRIEGIVQGASIDVSGAFAAATVQAKVGSVVPLPAALWLFLSGIGGLSTLVRRSRPSTSLA